MEDLSVLFVFVCEFCDEVLCCWEEGWEAKQKKKYVNADSKQPAHPTPIASLALSFSSSREVCILWVAFLLSFPFYRFWWLLFLPVSLSLSLSRRSGPAVSSLPFLLLLLLLLLGFLLV